MSVICIKIADGRGRTVALARGEDEVNLMCTRQYIEGDTIIVEAADTPLHLLLSVDDALGHSLVYARDWLRYEIPFW